MKAAMKSRTTSSAHGDPLTSFIVAQPSLGVESANQTRPEIGKSDDFKLPGYEATRGSSSHLPSSTADASTFPK
jgi:hypothetical protein